MIRFFIPAAPTPKGSAKLKYSFRRKGMIVVPDNGEKQASFKAIALPVLNQAMAGKARLGGNVALKARYYVPRPVSVYRARPNVKPDLDKLLRMLLDVCTEAGVWNDDGQVVNIDAAKYYADDEHAIGVHVWIREARA